MKKHIQRVKRHLQHPVIKAVIAVFLVCMLIFFLVPRKKAGPGFEGIDVLTKYVSTRPELPPMDNNNVLKPDYTKFYMANLETYWQKRFNIIKEWLGLKKRLWSVELFTQELARLVKEREAKSPGEDFITKLSLPEGSNVAIFGDIQGAFHSMSRCLGHMVDIGFMDKTLKVTDPKGYIVLMGDAISRSPYNIETLSLIISLMLKNPDRFIYIKGNHESNNYWQGFGLKTELILRAADLSKDRVPFEGLVNKLFNSLPHGLYLDMGDKHFVKISPKETAGKGEETEKICSKFLGEKSSQEVSFCSRKTAGDGAEGDLVIKAIIRAEEKKKDFQSMDGMRMVASEGDAVVWALLSCPTLAYQQGLKFYSDAFAVIKTASFREGWTITVHSQDSREKKGFITRLHNLLSGKEGDLGTKGESAQKPQDPVKKTAEKKEAPLAEKAAPEKGEQQEKEKPVKEKADEPLLKDLSATVATPATPGPSITDPTVTVTKEELKAVVREVVSEFLEKKVAEKVAKPAEPPVEKAPQVEHLDEKIAEPQEAALDEDEEIIIPEEDEEAELEEETEIPEEPDYTGALDVSVNLG